jgi:hypothetical protein
MIGNVFEPRVLVLRVLAELLAVIAPASSPLADRHRGGLATAQSALSLDLAAFRKKLRRLEANARRSFLILDDLPSESNERLGRDVLPDRLGGRVTLRARV